MSSGPSPDAPAIGIPGAPPIAEAPPAGATEGLRRTFSAFGERDFRIFWLGQLVSVTGTWMQTVAQGWLILVLTGSPFVLGVAAAAIAGLRTSPMTGARRPIATGMSTTL